MLSSFPGRNIQICYSISHLKNSEMEKKKKKQEKFLPNTTSYTTVPNFLCSLHNQVSQRSCLYILTLLPFFLVFNSHHSGPLFPSYIKTYLLK